MKYRAISHGQNDSPLSEIATREVVTLPPSDSIGKAALIMADRRISSIVVTEGKRPIGILTERDMLAALQNDLDPETEIGGMMSFPVVTVSESISCMSAYQQCLRNDIRHLVLVDDEGSISGVISETDFRRSIHLTTLAGRRQVSSVMNRGIFAFPGETPLVAALEHMNAHHDSCIVVIEEGLPAGILTERDIVRLYSRSRHRQHFPLSEVMTSPVLTISESATINEAASRMLEHRIRHLVAVDPAGHACGLLGEHELTQAMAAGMVNDKLIEEGSFLHSLINTIPDMIWLKDLGGTYLACNPRFEQFFGTKEEEIVGKTDYDFMDQMQAESFRDGDLSAVLSGIPILREERVTFAADGHMELLETVKTPMRDGNGNLIGVLGIARDITRRKNAELALLQSERRLREQEELFHAIFSQAPSGIELIDPETLRFVEVNPAACRMLGYSHEEYLALSLPDIQADLDRESLKASIERTESIGIKAFENRHRTKDGKILDVEIQARILDHAGRKLLVGIWNDVTERKRAEESLKITAGVFEISQEAILITDSENSIVDVNPAFTRITGYSRKEVLGKNPSMLGSSRHDAAFFEAMWNSLKENGSWRGEIWNRRKSGEIYAELLSISAINGDDGRVQRHVGVFSDISHMKAHEAELSRLAHYDALTAIPNRVLLADRLSQAIHRARRSGRMFAVCYMDLDGFKLVNDRHGHEIGDRLLVAVTRRLQESLRSDDTLARLGGDEFAALIGDLGSEIECFQILDRILENVAKPVHVSGQELSVSTSIGVTFFPSDEEDGDTLLRHADQAMYVAKQNGRNRYHLYDPRHDQKMRSLHESRKRILQGLENGEFELYYQPKILLASGEVEGVEALIRWNHPSFGIQLPGEFLPHIADSDAEIILDKWVLDRALATMEQWATKGLSFGIAVNISARRLQSRDFLADLSQKLEIHPGLERGRLQIEILETAALEDISLSAKTMESCIELGVGFALDDFGTGYSSLAYLRKLRAETLKIDQTFVRGMLEDEGDRAIVEGIIALARTFGRKTVAEGVETPELVEILKKMGCLYGQGYAIAHPMKENEFLDWYRGRRKDG